MQLCAPRATRCAVSAKRIRSTHPLCYPHSTASNTDASAHNVTSNIITDEFAFIRDSYELPRNPLIFAHGLLGFDELYITGTRIPFVQYWKGIVEALKSRGIDSIATAVPPSGSIEARAEELGKRIAERAAGRSVNIIAHSMGGLDARYMISRLRPPNVDVRSLTTISSPHRGSAFADHIIDEIGTKNLEKVYRALERLNLETKAFGELTRRYMQEEFNPRTPDVDGIKYYSYGSSCEPPWWSSFRIPHDIISRLENSPNDGLVSVQSSRWGTYKGTLVGVNHLDVINWTNWSSRFWELAGWPRKFNAIAFYLSIADMLAKEGM